jgi:uncharacterized cofD-like protein
MNFEAPAPRVVALGGGHGLAASLTALRHVTSSLTAVVTVADDGGSSGRLRREMGVLPPGDMRMALAALCGDDEWGRTWSSVFQHRFGGGGSLHDHAVGNLIMVALDELLDDPVAALDWMAKLLKAHGRVLPMSTTPLDITAEVVGLDPDDPRAVTHVAGQVEVATTKGRVVTVALEPSDPPACPQAIEAIDEADWVVLGPGSWMTSVLPHLLVPELAQALSRTNARRMVTLNLVPQRGETSGFTPENHIEVLAATAPTLRVDVVLADRGNVPDPESLRRCAKAIGAELVLAEVASTEAPSRHDPERLAGAYGDLMLRGRIAAWQ